MYTLHTKNVEKSQKYQKKLKKPLWMPQACPTMYTLYTKLPLKTPKFFFLKFYEQINNILKRILIYIKPSFLTKKRFILFLLAPKTHLGPYRFSTHGKLYGVCCVFGARQNKNWTPKMYMAYIFLNNNYIIEFRKQQNLYIRVI